MKREPPQLAAWLLEHGIPGDPDPALAGDLLEDYRSGRSEGWFWRQALSAWLVGWVKYLSERRFLLVFAVLWSMLAPAWSAVVDRIENSPNLLNPAWTASHLFTMFWLWVALNLVFLWAGMLVFVALHTRFARAFSKAHLKRAFTLTPLLFMPIYFATFVFMNLFAYPGLEIKQGLLIPLGELIDLKLRADVLRIPYFLTLLWAMWEATPRLAAISMPLLERKPSKAPPPPEAAPAILPSSQVDPYTLKRFLFFVIGTGLLNALIAGFLLCRLPDAHNPSVFILARRAVLYVLLGGIFGVAGIYLYWKNPASPFRNAAPLPFWLFALTCTSAWIWVPAMVIFSEQLSGLTALVAAIGATLLAAGLRHATSSLFAPPPRASLDPEPSELFTETLYRAPFEIEGYLIALSLYAAGWALATHSNYTACTLLALAAFLFAWKRTFIRNPHTDARSEYRRAALRLALALIPAILFTFWSLLDGVAHRNRLEAASALAAARANPAPGEDAKQDPKTPASANGTSGYQSVILWPVVDKKQIIPPVPRLINLLAPGTTKPLVIRFDGPYFYFQPPHKQPSNNAHQAHGTPLAIDVKTNNFVSLIMQAHQKLGVSIPVARCRELQVDLLNRDNNRGFIRVAVFLEDTTAPDYQLFLGQQTLPSSEPENFRVKFTPQPESLHFAIPNPAKLRKFDQITVMLLPDESNYDRAPKVAIDQFQIQPR